MVAHATMKQKKSPIITVLCAVLAPLDTHAGVILEVARGFAGKLVCRLVMQGVPPEQLAAGAQTVSSLASVLAIAASELDAPGAEPEPASGPDNASSPASDDGGSWAVFVKGAS